MSKYLLAVVIAPIRKPVVNLKIKTGLCKGNNLLTARSNGVKAIGDVILTHLQKFVQQTLGLVSTAEGTANGAVSKAEQICKG